MNAVTGLSLGNKKLLAFIRLRVIIIAALWLICFWPWIMGPKYNHQKDWLEHFRVRTLLSWEYPWYLRNQESKDRCDNQNIIFPTSIIYECTGGRFRLPCNVGTSVHTNTPHISRDQETSVDLRTYVPQNLRSGFLAWFRDLKPRS